MRWWTWSQCVRTLSILHFEFTLLGTTTPPLYQEISAKSVQLYQLGLSKSSIAAKLRVDEKTVSKAIQWAKFESQILQMTENTLYLCELDYQSLTYSSMCFSAIFVSEEYRSFISLGFVSNSLAISFTK